MRQIRTVVALSVAVFAVAAASGASAAAPRPRESCQTKGRTIAANQFVRVFARSGSGSSSALNHWACPARGQRAHFMFDAERFGANRWPLVSLAARFVGYLRLDCLYGDHDSVLSCDGSIRAYDAVRRRERVHELPEAAIARSPREVTGLVTTRSGWVAWTAYSVTGQDFEVWSLPPRGAAQRIAGLPHEGYWDAPRDSLAVAGDRIYWMHGEEPRTRLLAGSSAASASRARRRPAARRAGCMTEGATVSANRFVRIDELPGRDDAVDFWACSAWHRRRVELLGADSPSSEIEPRIATAGRFIAFADPRCSGRDHDSEGSCRWRVVTHDARQRTSTQQRLPADAGQVLSVAVTTRGWTAWSNHHPSTDAIQTWIRPPGRPAELVDAAALADPDFAVAANDTLAVRGDRLYWMSGETPKSRLLRTDGAVMAVAARLRPSPSCPTAGSTVAANGQVRVFEGGNDGGARDVDFTYWACRPGAKRAPRLLFGADLVEVRDRGPLLAVGGPFVAYPKVSCAPSQDDLHDVGSCRGGVSRYDARRDRFRFSRVAQDADGFVPSIASVVVSRRGWVAWTATPGGNYLEVWAWPPDGPAELIDRTITGVSGDAPESLALNGDRLYWKIDADVQSRLLR